MFKDFEVGRLFDLRPFPVFVGNQSRAPGTTPKSVLQTWKREFAQVTFKCVYGPNKLSQKHILQKDGIK